MLVTANENGLNDLPNLAEERVKRDRALAMAYVQRKEARTAVREIAKETGVYWRTVYRGIKRELEWAKAEWLRLNPPE